MSERDSIGCWVWQGSTQFTYLLLVMLGFARLNPTYSSILSPFPSNLDPHLLKMTAGIRAARGANFLIEFAFGIGDIFGCSDDDLR
jgi:hypothetical protein